MSRPDRARASVSCVDEHPSANASLSRQYYGVATLFRGKETYAVDTQTEGRHQCVAVDARHPNFFDVR